MAYQKSVGNGGCTVNELLVLSEVMCCYHEKRLLSYSQIAEKSGVSRSMVSRYMAGFVRKGYIKEVPLDGRTIAPQVISKDRLVRFEKAMRQVHAESVEWARRLGTTP